jgi:hypothetical protein
MQPLADEFAFSNFSSLPVYGSDKLVLLLPRALMSLHKLSTSAELPNIISVWRDRSLQTDFSLPLWSRFLFESSAGDAAQKPTTLVAKFLSTKPAQLQQSIYYFYNNTFHQICVRSIVHNA